MTKDLQILVAEDNKVNQELTKRILEKAGFLVSIANNGREAVNLFNQNEFDLILMDIQMPVMGGEEAVQAIRKSKKGGNIPIVALTAHAMSGDQEKYLDIGMNGYVSKPIRRSDLLETIQELFDNS